MATAVIYTVAFMLVHVTSTILASVNLNLFQNISHLDRNKEVQDKSCKMWWWWFHIDRLNTQANMISYRILEIIFLRTTLKGSASR